MINYCWKYNEDWGGKVKYHNGPWIVCFPVYITGTGLKK